MNIFALLAANAAMIWQYSRELLKRRSLLFLHWKSLIHNNIFYHLREKELEIKSFNSDVIGFLPPSYSIEKWIALKIFF